MLLIAPVVVHFCLFSLCARWVEDGSSGDGEGTDLVYDIQAVGVGVSIEELKVCV